MTHGHTAEEIADALRGQIDSGAIRFRQLMPSPAVLAERWHVPKTTAQQALRTLRDEKLISRGRAESPAWAAGRRAIAAARASGLLAPPDRHAAGSEIPCGDRQCRNLAVWTLRSANPRFQVRPRVSCNKHRAQTEAHMLRGNGLFLTLSVEPFQDPTERPSTKRRARR